MVFVFLYNRIIDDNMSINQLTAFLLIGKKNTTKSTDFMHTKQKPLPAIKYTLITKENQFLLFIWFYSF